MKAVDLSVCHSNPLICPFIAMSTVWSDVSGVHLSSSILSGDLRLTDNGVALYIIAK